jgi:hypothetical protein
MLEMLELATMDFFVDIIRSIFYRDVFSCMPQSNVPITVLLLSKENERLAFGRGI